MGTDVCVCVISQTYDMCIFTFYISKLECVGFFSFQDSPSNKLLFAKDIPSYRKTVDRYFREIHEMAPVSDQEMAGYLNSVSRVCHENYFIVSACLLPTNASLIPLILDAMQVYLTVEK